MHLHEIVAGKEMASVKTCCYLCINPLALQILASLFDITRREDI